MATWTENVEEKKNNLLICSICLEMFKTPKYLPCLHSFCKLCINTYILSFVARENINNGFKCPICRKFVTIGRDCSNSDYWVDELPNNHLIISMLELKAIQKLETLCNACELSSVNQKAVSWCTICLEAMCSSCENCHRKFKMTSHHKIMTLNEVRADQKSSISGLITCDDHSGKFVEIYCLNHNKPCCAVCVTMKHCDCRKIAIIEEAAEGIKESKQTTDFLQLILHWKNVLEKSIEDTEKNMSAVAIIGNNLVLEIESLKKDVNEHIDRLEIAVKDELTTRKEERVTKLTDRGTKVSSLKSIVDNWHNIYRTCIHDGSEIHCLIEINKMILMKEKMASEIHTATSHIDEKSFRFERNQIVKYLQENVRSLGFINIVNTKPSTGLRLEPLCDSFSESFVHMPETSNFRKGTINKLFTLYIGDNDNNEVRGLFTEEFIFISSYKTDKLLKFDLNGKFLCDRKFKARSWCVTEFRGDELALIFGSSKEIHFLNVYTLVIERKINLAVSVNLLRYISENDQFVATCSMGRSIFWLNAISGEKIKEETASKNQQVHYICAYGSNGYVFTSGWNDNISLLVNNRIKYTYNNKDISRSRGVDIDFHGNLYLCCPNSVHQISPLGELIRKIPCEDIGTSNPCAIRFKQNSNLFLLTSFDSGKVVVAEIC